MLDRLSAWIRRLSGPSEGSSDYDGLLSYATEWHALLIGVGAGLVAGWTMMPLLAAATIACALGIRGLKGVPKIRDRAAIRELQAEPWYGIGGTLLGYLLATVGAGVV